MSWYLLIANLSTLFTLLISVYNIGQQYTHLQRPKFQLYICRILSMIPVYAILSHISFISPSHAVILNIIRDCYETYVLFSFLKLLIYFLDGDNAVIKSLEERGYLVNIFPHHHILYLINILDYTGKHLPDYTYKKQINKLCNGNNHCCRENKNTLISKCNDVIPCCNCCRYYKEVIRFYTFIKLGVLQFVIIKPTVTLSALYLESIGKYGAGSFSLYTGFPYIAFLNSVSVSLTIYSLFLLYISVYEKLKPMKPILKFLCIKLIVFVSSWQSLIISLLSTVNILPLEPIKALFINNWLLTLEMSIFAVIYGFAFSYKDFISTRYIYNKDNYTSKFITEKSSLNIDHDYYDIEYNIFPININTHGKKVLDNVLTILSPQDIIQDAQKTFKMIGNSSSLISSGSTIIESIILSDNIPMKPVHFEDF
ncbi:hypothetical protein cand_002360 [Cryptosporidium andersoni]|uniref:Uncharacterized protein n=1 Tax=Cryptosporidium andersoni TaxID=117008 RepID=A0A1J4MNT8_9CRYT|nr:hypothetical protein cand_002360 [Cryptosporidium andersoni]